MRKGVVESLAGPVAVAVLLVVAYAGYRIWRRMPPYEQGLHTVEAQSRSGAGEPPHIGKCPVFPADSVWNTPVDTLPVLAQSQEYVDSIGALHKVHADFGHSMHYGLPYSEVPPGTKPVPVEFDNVEESDTGRYPVPADAPIEGGPKAGGDRHVIMVDTDNCVLYELYHATPVEGGWKADSGIRMDLTRDALRPAGKTSADAAGLPIFPGLVRYDEVAAGEINHALRFTVQHSQAAYVWPARHRSSPSTDAKLPPMGVRFRLRADFDLSRFTPNDQVIMRALKRYGMFVADNGSSMYLSGASDKRFSDDDLRGLSGMMANDFEAVDESGLEMLPDSGRAKGR